MQTCIHKYTHDYQRCSNYWIGLCLLHMHMYRELHRLTCGGFHKWGYPTSWMVYKGKSISKLDDDWGYAHLRKPPHRVDVFCPKNNRHRSTAQMNRWRSRPVACSFIDQEEEDQASAPEKICEFLMLSGWWFEPQWKILVSWDDYSQYMGK